MTAAQWAQDTPCPGWTVRDLVNHLVAGDLLFTALLSGAPPRSPDELLSGGDDRLGDDPVAAHRSASDGLLAAFRRPGVTEQVLQVPIGPVPGTVALHLRITETLVHGWDLAHATGQAVPFADDLAEQELAFTVAKLSDLPPGRRPFGPPQPLSEQAPAVDRLAACLGRTVAT